MERNKTDNAKCISFGKKVSVDFTFFNEYTMGVESTISNHCCYL